MQIKFHERAAFMFAAKQNAEGNSVVKTSAETTGTITSLTNSTGIVGVGTKFLYGSTVGDGMGELTVGAYVFDATGTNIIGRVASIASNTVATLEDNAAYAVTGQEFSTGLGPKNCLAVFNLNYVTELTSEESSYVGDELDRNSYTTITDKYCRMTFETFVPRLKPLAGANPTVNEIPYPIWFEAAGLGIILSTDGSGKVTYTNSVTSNALLTIEYRRASQDNSTINKVFTSFDCRGMVDLDATIKTRGKLSWDFMGNFQNLLDKPKLIPDEATLNVQRDYTAPTLNATGIFTSQLSTYTNGTAPTFVTGTKNICFSKVMVPNVVGWDYQRYSTSCQDGWSKGATTSDLTLTIIEDRANASYNPHNNLENFHSLWVEYSGNGQTEGSVRFSWDKLQLTNIVNTTVATFAGQDLTFRNSGKISIVFTESTSGSGGGSVPTVSTKPRYGIGVATVQSNTVGIANLFASLTEITTSSAGSRIAGSSGSPLSVNPATNQYGWFFCLATAAPSGVTFNTSIGPEGWNGATLSGGNSGASPIPSTVRITYIDADNNLWYGYRQDMSASPVDFWTT